MDAGTIYYTLDGSDPRRSAVRVNPAAIQYNGAFRLDQSATVRVRALNGTDWSAIDEAEFLVGVIPAGPGQSESCRSPLQPRPGDRRRDRGGFRRQR